MNYVTNFMEHFGRMSQMWQNNIGPGFYNLDGLRKWGTELKDAGAGKWVLKDRVRDPYNI